ncbi:helix-turn-helix domain-containing protein [Bacillus sp. 03113]|uniref:helix-turn-helix domain-containing protein n=1 Tax=Bacillus sp. 03113 TaxID=2578211 RepID=UPI0011435CAA|nr:helix-turn-helix transcriptional regulator [Bacillus sp. 03113]
MLKQLEHLRKKNNWSQQDAADRLGIAKSTYAGYESGYRRPPLQALIQIADLFDVSIDYLLGREIHSKVEVIEMLHHEKPCLFIDNVPLDLEELSEFIAFIRVKRGIRTE